MTGDRPRRRVIALNDIGRQIGQGHHRATLTDDQIEAMRDRHENDGIGYRRLAKEFGCSRTHAQDVCNYRRRNHWTDRYKTVDN